MKETIIKCGVLIVGILALGTAFAQETEFVSPPPPAPEKVEETELPPEPELVPPPRMVEMKDDSVIMDFPDEQPEFPGGFAERQKYLMANLRYPQEAIENHDEGRIYVVFIVEKDGSLSSIEIELGAAVSLNKEALRLVQNMPNWIPAKQKGEPVRTHFRLPIVFHLVEMNDTQERKRKKRKKKKNEDEK